MFKRNKATHLLALFLAITLLFTACGSDSGSTGGDTGNTGSGNDTSTSSTDTSNGDSASTTAADTDPFGSYDPPVSFSFAYRTQPVIDFPDGDSIYDNVWTREFAKYGIEMDVLWAADQATGDYDTRLAISMAAGDVPDIFVGGTYATLHNAYEAGILADLSEVFDLYGSEEVKALKARNEDLFQSSYIDGKLVAIPGLGNPIGMESNFLWIRDDWMANLGLGAPKTLEDVIEIARAFTYDDPDGNGVNDTYGLGLQKEMFNNTFGDMMGFAAAFGAPTLSRNDNDFWYEGPDGNIINGSVQPGMRDALLALQQMYADGLIDREFGVKDASALEADINTGKVGMLFGANYGGFYPYATLYNSDPTARFSPYPVPAASGHELLMGAPWPVQGYFMLNNSYAHPEVFVKLLNINRAINNEDITAETAAIYTDNGLWMLAPIMISEPVTFRHSQEITDAINNDDGGANISTNNAFERYIMVNDFIETGINDNHQYGWWSQIGPESTAAIVMNDYAPNNKFRLTSVIGTQPTSMIEKLPHLLDMRDQVFTEIIQGGDISLFDAFVEDWLKAGGEEIMNDLTEIYGRE